MARIERCPQCGSTHLTGRAFDMAGGDELQERYCYDCEYGESRLRSEGGVGWSVEVPPQPPHRMHGAKDVERALLDEIYAAPDDDGVRSIYADWLIERGDPLGTFISLQLARVRRRDAVVSAEEQALLDTSWSAWIGMPSIAIDVRQIAFERGLWSFVDGWKLRPLDPALLQARSWGTVRRLNVGPALAAQLAQLLAGPLRRSLRYLQVPHRAALEVVAAAAPPLDTLEIAFDTSRDPPPLAPLSRLPALRTLYFHAMAEFAPRWIERAAELPVTEVIFGPYVTRVDDLAAVLRAARKTQITKLSFVSTLFTLHVEHDGSALAIRRVELHPTKQLPPYDAIVAAKTALDKHAAHADPGAKLTLPAINPDLAQFAEERGAKLVAAPQSFAARPTT